MTEPVQILKCRSSVRSPRYRLRAGAPREVLPNLAEPVDDRVVLLDVDDGTSARVVRTGLPCQLTPSVEFKRDAERL